MSDSMYGGDIRPMTDPYRKPSMRDRLQAACDPHTVAYYDRDEILARVLAVLADPDDETALAIYRAISLAESLDDAPCAALAALVAHLTGEAS